MNGWDSGIIRSKFAFITTRCADHPRRTVNARHRTTITGRWLKISRSRKEPLSRPVSAAWSKSPESVTASFLALESALDRAALR